MSAAEKDFMTSGAYGVPYMVIARKDKNQLDVRLNPVTVAGADGSYAALSVKIRMYAKTGDEVRSFPNDTFGFEMSAVGTGSGDYRKASLQLLMAKLPADQYAIREYIIEQNLLSKLANYLVDRLGEYGAEVVQTPANIVSFFLETLDRVLPARPATVLVQNAEITEVDLRKAEMYFAGEDEEGDDEDENDDDEDEDEEEPNY